MIIMMLGGMSANYSPPHPQGCESRYEWIFIPMNLHPGIQAGPYPSKNALGWELWIRALPFALQLTKIMSNTDMK